MTENTVVKNVDKGTAQKVEATKVEAKKVPMEQRTCEICGKPIWAKPGQTVGSTCQDHIGKIRRYANEATAIPEGWLGMSKVCREADKAGIGTRAIVKAAGGDAATEPLLDPVFQVTYVGKRKYMNPEVLTKGFALLRKQKDAPKEAAVVANLKAGK